MQLFAIFVGMKSKKKTNKTTAVKTPRGKKLHVTVDGNFDFTKMFPPESPCSYRVEGYTFTLGEAGMVLPEGSVEFVNCRFSGGGDFVGAINASGKVTFTGCEFGPRECIRVIEHQQCNCYGVAMYGCSGGHVGITGPESMRTSIEIVESNFISLGVRKFFSVYMSRIRARYVNLYEVDGSVTFSNSTLAPEEGNDRACVLYMQKLFNTPILIDMCSMPGEVNLESSCVMELDLRGTDVEMLSFQRATISRIITDMMTTVRIIRARCSACAGSSTYPGFHTLTAMYRSDGFPAGNATLYKKVTMHRPFHKDVPVILKLEVPRYADARFDAFSRKVRVSEAKVVSAHRILLDDEGKPTSIQDMKVPAFASLLSNFDRSFRYRIGKTARPKSPFDMSDSDCSSGIHGFLDPMEAAKY